MLTDYQAREVHRRIEEQLRRRAATAWMGRDRDVSSPRARRRR